MGHDAAVDLDPVQGGFRAHVGYCLAAWTADSAVVCLDVRAHHLNRSGVVHGGVLATMLDAAGGYSGLYCTVAGNVRRCLSVSFSQMFIAPGRPPRLDVRARMLSSTRASFFAEMLAYDAEGLLIGSAQGVYRWTAGSETAEGRREGLA